MRKALETGPFVCRRIAAPCGWSNAWSNSPPGRTSAVDAAWVIGLDSWIVQDGNYRDFSEGQDAAFAVEFFPGELGVIRGTNPTASHLGGNRYRIEGQVVFASARAWVLDCGICMYEEHPPPTGVAVGAFVEGEVCLGVDPFFYYEELAKLPDMPPLVYGWHIARIELDLAPWIEVKPRTFERDTTRPGWKDVDATDAWNDDGGNAHYLLHSRLLDRPATRHPAHGRSRRSAAPGSTATNRTG